jgi:hypothetical protein
VHSEYAVEPAAIGADWNTFKYIIEKFGYDKGRLISRLPGKWEKKVLAAAKGAGVSDIQISSMIERLKNTNMTRIADFGRTYDGSQCWVDNALREHAVRPFRGIICAEKPAGCAEALTAADCDEENDLMEAPISRDVARVSPPCLVASSCRVITYRALNCHRPHLGGHNWMQRVAAVFSIADLGVVCSESQSRALLPSMRSTVERLAERLYNLAT